MIGGEDEEPEDHRDMKEKQENHELVQTEAQEEKQVQQVQVDTLKVKWWVWAILISALFAVSSAGILFIFVSLFSLPSSFLIHEFSSTFI